MSLKGLLDSLAGAIYTPRCLSCDKAVQVSKLCSDCSDQIQFLGHEVEAEVHNHYATIVALTAYEGLMLELVHKFKYGKGRGVDRLIDDFVKQSTPVIDEIDGIVPVPSSFRRYVKRNYNQSVILAKMISNLLEKPVYYRAIKKGRHTERQVGKSLDERRENLKKSFSRPRFMPTDVRDKRLLLIDDVVTTGSTVDECSKVLKRAGARRVDVLTLCKTL